MWLFTLILLNLHSVFGQKCLKELRVQSSENRSITISWRYECPGNPHNDVDFKIYYEHRAWKACNPSKKVSVLVKFGECDLRETSEKVISCFTICVKHELR